MKRYLSYSLSVLILSGLMAFQPKPRPKPTSAKAPGVALSDKPYAVKWADTFQDLGVIIEGQPVRATFIVTNSGKGSMHIHQVETGGRSSTHISYSKEPILPGKRGEIEVGLNSYGKSGMHTKDFKVITNGGEQVLKIRYKVVEEVQGDSIPGLDWDKLEYNFGKIQEGEKVETVFTLTNNRKDTLEIENVAGSCGCLSPKWTKGRVRGIL